jgi:pimeloyl-ACP methyl ester carboxylesterase
MPAALDAIPAAPHRPAMSDTLRRGYIDTPFGQIHYRTQDSEGPWLFLFHTSPLSGGEYAGVFPHLKGRVRAVAFDNPGYGMSDPPPQPPSLHDYSAPLCAAIDHFKVERFALAGTHTGASLAIYAATQLLKGRVTHLVFSGLPLKTPEESQHLRATSVMVESAQDGSHLAEAWTRTRNRWGQTTDPRIIEWALASGLMRTDGTNMPSRASDAFDMAGALRALTMPVLFVNGPHDPLIAQDRRAVPLVPHAKLNLIDAPTGLSAPHAAPALYARALLDFIGA